jgi:hypothetical protein
MRRVLEQVAEIARDLQQRAANQFGRWSSLFRGRRTPTTPRAENEPVIRITVMGNRHCRAGAGATA